MPRVRHRSDPAAALQGRLGRAAGGVLAALSPVRKAPAGRHRLGRRLFRRRRGRRAGEAVATAKCSGITRAGGRCKLEATNGSYCWNHAPETASARKQRARRGGRAGGNGRGGVSEVAEAKSLAKGILSRLLSGALARDTATAAFQGLNTLARLVEIERKIREQDALEDRIEALEARRDEAGYRGWRNHR